MGISCESLCNYSLLPLSSNFFDVEKQLVVNNHRVNYSVLGSGPALVLLHGFLESMAIWDDFAQALSKTNKVITIDLPGFGKTDVFSDNHTMEMMADTVEAVLKNEKVKQCVLAGHSMGGYVSLAFAKKYEHYLKGLVLFHSHAAADDEQGKINRNRTIEIVKKNHKDFITGFIPLLFAEQNIEKFSEKIDWLKSISLKTSAEGITAALAGMRDREDHTALLAQLQIPILFIVGKQDSRIPIEKIMPQVAFPKHSEALILDNVGHMGFAEARVQTLRTLAHFGIKWF